MKIYTLIFYFISIVAYSQNSNFKPHIPFRVDTVNQVSGVFCSDSGMDLFGVQHIVQEGVVYERDDSSGGDFEVRLIDAPKDLFDRRQLKFRYGFSYAKSKSKILKYNRATSRWQIVLDSPRHFSTFEVTFHGQIILFGTFANIDSKSPRRSWTLEKKDLEEGAQIETWEMGGSAPISSVPYDSVDKSLAMAVEGLRSYNRTWIYRDLIVFYNDYIGRMGILDLTAKSIKWVKTPWEGLTLEGLKSWEKESKKTLDLGRHGQILIDAFDVPPEGGIQFCPNEVSPKIVFYRFFAIEGKELPSIRTTENSDAKPVVILPQPVSPDSRGAKITIGTLDLEKSEIFVDQVIDPPTGGAFWVDKEGKVASLEKVLTPSKSKSSMDKVEDPHRVQPIQSVRP